jgi:hypothetical protein
LIQLDGEILKEIIQNLTIKYQQTQAKITEQPLAEVIKQLPEKLTNRFWDAPTWLIAVISAVVFTIVIVGVDENSLIGKASSGAGTISFFLALV